MGLRAPWEWGGVGAGLVQPGKGSSKVFQGQVYLPPCP